MLLSGWEYSRGKRSQCASCKKDTVGQVRNQGITIPCCPTCRDSEAINDQLRPKTAELIEDDPDFETTFPEFVISNDKQPAEWYLKNGYWTMNLGNNLIRLEIQDNMSGTYRAYIEGKTYKNPATVDGMFETLELAQMALIEQTARMLNSVLVSLADYLYSQPGTDMLNRALDAIPHFIHNLAQETTNA